MTAALVLPDSIYTSICSAAREELETAGVLLVSIVKTDRVTRILAREFFLLPNEAYLRRARDELIAIPDGYMPALARAEEIGAVAIWFHTHPGDEGIPFPSAKDHGVDELLKPVFANRTGSDQYGTLIVSPFGESIQFTAALHEQGKAPTEVERLFVVGERIRNMPAYGRKLAALSPEFDRNIRAFGGEIQATLGHIRVGVVGCGGTGSAVAEQLARLGVRNFLLVDPDFLSASNVTRVFGSSESDVGKPKVEILASHLKSISSSVHASTYLSTVNVEPTARKLASCDVIFGCTDDNAGRLVLSRLAIYCLIPTFDCGVLLTSGINGVLEGINGRVTSVVPGSACLVCRNRIDVRKAAAEQMNSDERSRLEKEGYAPALGHIEPAVVTFTSAVASAAVNELLERLVGFGPDARPSEILLRFHEREISTNHSKPKSQHYCDPFSGKIGRGISEPFLDQIWTN